MNISCSFIFKVNLSISTFLLYFEWKTSTFPEYIFSSVVCLFLFFFFIWKLLWWAHRTSKITGNIRHLLRLKAAVLLISENPETHYKVPISPFDWYHLSPLSIKSFSHHTLSTTQSSREIKWHRHSLWNNKNDAFNTQSKSKISCDITVAHLCSNEEFRPLKPNSTGCEMRLNDSSHCAEQHWMIPGLTGIDESKKHHNGSETSAGLRGRIRSPSAQNEQISCPECSGGFYFFP